MSDQRAPDERTGGGDVDDDNEALKAFRRKSSPGVWQFFYDWWPAWMIDTERNRLAPLCRIMIGDDDDGSLLIDKHVILTGLLHLAINLTRTAESTIQRASEISGFVMDTPGGEAHVLELIDDLQGSLKEIREIIENKKMFAAVEDDEHH